MSSLAELAFDVNQAILWRVRQDKFLVKCVHLFASVQC